MWNYNLHEWVFFTRENVFQQFGKKKFVIILRDIIGLEKFRVKGKQAMDQKYLHRFML